MIKNFSIIAIFSIISFALFAFCSQRAMADTGTFYMQGCDNGRATLAWFIPNAFGTHKQPSPNWFMETPLNAAYLEFAKAFEGGCQLGDPCYNLVLDVDVDGENTAADFGVLAERWMGNPSVVGTHITIPARGGASFPDGSCVNVTWTSALFNPLINLYMACVGPDGKTVAFPDGKWHGPALVATETYICEGGRF